MLSVIIPCYNEEECIDACHENLSRVLAQVCVENQLEYELVFVDDGSQDRTFVKLAELHERDPHTVACALSRNFGHQIAVTAGLALVRGDAAVIIDADLQDPPELIGEMVRRWKEGYNVVYGVREERRGESLFKLWTAKFFYRLINSLSDVKIPLDAGDFRLVDRRVIDAMLRMPEHNRLLRAMCSWVGYSQIGITYKRAPRYAGKTKYPLMKMVGLALNGITSFSILPLRALSIVGLCVAMLSFAGIGYALFVRLFTHHWVAGWATLFIAMLFLNGVQFLALGILGEYMGRTYSEVRNRPLYLLRDVLRRDVDQAAHPCAAEFPIFTAEVECLNSRGLL